MGVQIQPLINGQTYGWGDISVIIGATPVIGIKAIKYGEAQAKANVYGAGSYPIARSKGRITPTASITLMVETVMALEAIAPDGKLFKLPPFPIVVMYQPEAGAIVQDTIMNAEFKDSMKDWKEGDMEKDVVCELLISHVVRKK
jgi:hypothetical protein